MRHVFYPILTSLSLLLAIILLSQGCQEVGVFDLLAVEQRKVVIGLFVLCWVGGITSWIMAKSVAIWSVRARPLSPEDLTATAGDLTATAQRLAPLFHIKAPDLAVYPSDEANAFAVGWLRNHSLIVVTTGLLSRLQPAQAEAVLAHEMAKISRRDVSTLLLTHGMLNVFTIFPARMLAFIFGTSLRTFEDETPSDEVEIGIMMTLEILVAGLATLVVRQFSRRAEARADRDAAAAIGSTNLVQALGILEGQAPKRSHREVFVWPVKFGATVKARLAAIAYHLPPARRIAALK